MNSKELKQYIIDYDKTIPILEKIGMHNISEKTDYISCSFPDGDNHTGCIVYPSLFITAYTRKIVNKMGFQTDIFDLVEFVTGKPSIPFIMGYLGLSNTVSFNEPKKNDGLDIFRRVKKKNKSNQINPIDESILDRYLKQCHISFVKDGILPTTALEWEIGIDIDSNRITFVHRHWYTGQIVAIVGRTLTQAYSELGIDKYLTIVGKGHKKSENLYGLYKNRDDIEKLKQIIIVEGEKSVIKLWQYGYRNAVSVGCHNIDDKQIAILLTLGIKEVVIAFDSDVHIDEIKKSCKKIYDNGIMVSYIDVSKIKLFQDKCSPCDKGIKRWNLLYKHRKQYTLESEELDE